MADRRRRISAAAIAALVGVVVIASAVAAHPLGNFTINRAIAIEIGRTVSVRYLIDMAEIPAFEAIQELDVDGDDLRSPDEVDAFARSTCEAAMADLDVTLDATESALAEAADPTIAFPAGVGGLETLRIECAFAVRPDPDADSEHTLEIADRTTTERIGWHEVTARAHGAAMISGSDVPEISPSEELTAYPADALSSPPDVRSASFRFRLDGRASATEPPARGAPAERSVSPDPLAALVGGELSVPIVLLALLVALALGALHALSPGHGKTLVAAYVLGAGGTARSAFQIGLSVAISHTVGVFALGVLVLVASELFLPERVIAWLSLVSGIVVAGLGIVLVVRQVITLRGRSGSAHGHDHGHDHGHGEHGHTHEPPAGVLTWRSAVALGFAGGAVPSASAVIVLLVAISSDRLAFGSVLILMFGIGMAIVLGGLGLVIARVRGAASRSQSRWLASPRSRRIGGAIPLIAGIVVFSTGVAFAYAAATQLS